ncbi:MAG: acyltransferase family protein [Gemmatimonadaceae bacterium]
MLQPAPRQGTAGRDLPNLTGIRFVAAFWVLAFHTMPRTGLPRPVAALADAGYAGVGLFFVLSGFILAHVYGIAAVAEQPFPTRRFLVARFARVYPAYLAALVFALPAFVRDVHVAAAPLSGRALAGVCLASVTMTQAWIPGWGCYWNCPGWSLSVEAFFYLSFPLIAPRLLRLRPGTLAAVGAGAWLAALVVGSGLADGARSASLMTDSWTAHLWLTAWTPLVRLPEFILGICAARLLRTPSGRPRLGPLGGWGAAAIIVLVAAFPYAPASGLLPWPGLSLPFALVIAALSGPDSRGLLASPRLQRLGNASYSLYLIHAVGHGYYLAAVNRLVGREFAVSWPSFLLYAALIIGAALLMHDAIEQPARTWLRRTV